MKQKTRKTFISEFRLETAQLVVDQNYTQEEAAKAMGVGKSTISKWGIKLHEERSGKAPRAMLMTPEQLEIRELKKAH